MAKCQWRSLGQIQQNRCCPRKCNYFIKKFVWNTLNVWKIGCLQILTSKKKYLFMTAVSIIILSLYCIEIIIVPLKDRIVETNVFKTNVYCWKNYSNNGRFKFFRQNKYSNRQRMNDCHSFCDKKIPNFKGWITAVKMVK